MPEKQGVYILAEVTHDGKPAPLTLELMGLGGELASKLDEKLYAVIVGSGLSEAAQDLAQYNPDTYLPIPKGLFTQKEPKAILLGHTSMGQDLAPRLAFGLGAGLITDCMGAEVEDGELRFARPVYGGNALATQRVTTETALATIRTRVSEAPSPEGEGKVNPVEVEIPEDVRIELRYPSLVAIKAAKSLPQTVLASSDLDLDLSGPGLVETVALSAPSRERRCTIIEADDPEEAGRKLAGRLREDRVI